jgi:hypothetical protein
LSWFEVLLVRGVTAVTLLRWLAPGCALIGIWRCRTERVLISSNWHVTVWLLTLGIGDALFATGVTTLSNCVPEKNTSLSEPAMRRTLRSRDVDQAIDLTPLVIAGGTRHVRRQARVRV